MYNKENIMCIIDECQKEIEELNEVLNNTTNKVMIDELGVRLSSLYAKKYWYKLQARAWGLIKF